LGLHNLNELFNTTKERIMLVERPKCQRQISSLLPLCPNGGTSANNVPVAADSSAGDAGKKRLGIGKKRWLGGLLALLLALTIGVPLAAYPSENGEKPVNLCPICIGGKFGYINAQGELVIAPKLDYANDFDANGLAQIQENGLWGYINTKGEMVIAPKFDGVGGFAANGLAKIR